MITYEGKYTTADVMTDEIDVETANQINHFINDQSFTGPVKIMPDCHYGKGAVIGFTMPLGDRVIPETIGVDIACGLRTVILECDRAALEGFKTREFDSKIRKLIKVGNKVYDKPVVNIERKLPWEKINMVAGLMTVKLNDKLGASFKSPKLNFEYFKSMCKRIGEDPWYAQCSCGSLGSGNHMAELGYSDDAELGYISVHSGSRHLGLMVAKYWQNTAAERASNKGKDSYFDSVKAIQLNFPRSEWESRIHELKDSPKVSKGLEWLEGEDMLNYLYDSIICYHFALASRAYMADVIIEALDVAKFGADSKIKVKDCIDTVHNYISPYDLIIRKGAVSAHANGEILVIPLNMEDGILICEGLGNPDWNFSAPHGAGRLMSRTQAKEHLNQEEAKESMKSKGIFSSVLPKDELKGAYKSSQMIIDSIAPTARIMFHMKPIINFKGG